MTTTKLGLPMISGNMNADVVRDMNALAQAIDDKVGVPNGLATLDGNGNVNGVDLSTLATKQELSTHLAEKVSENDDPHGWLSASRFKIGTFTRLTTLSNSLQSITGLGFKPKSILFIAAVEGKPGRMSIGFTNGIAENLSLYDYFQTTNNSYKGSFTRCIAIQQGTSENHMYVGLLNSFDIDGFTIDWRKGSLAVDGETITVQYLAFR
ncbi:hypothetical protein V7149_00120 [Bacillus sp. JJ1503]|uniref:hypothetical protein n=1 Tax=Bacillus sp. JJ1503 TaxID=3122956 RepID=UPI002FFFBDED